MLPINLKMQGVAGAISGAISGILGIELISGIEAVFFAVELISSIELGGCNGGKGNFGSI